MSAPPGTSGLPLIGETFAFLRDTFGFVSSRVKEHGPIFRTSLLGNPTVFLTGPEACEIWLDEDIIQRGGSFPDNIEQLFGGKSLPLLDGSVHRTRKELVMSAFNRAGLAAYVPILEETTRATLDRWAALETEAGGSNGVPPVMALPGLKRLAIEGIARSVFGVSDDALVEELLGDYEKVALGFTGLPIRFPGTAYYQALEARDRILARIEKLIAERRRSPGEDGISRIIGARTKDGATLEDAGLVLELHHSMLAGLIIFAEFAATISALSDHPAIRKRLVEELESSGKTKDYTLDDLAKSTYLLHFVMEVKRTCPNVPVSFGKAKREFTFNGATVPAGWFVFMATFENNLSTSSFESPETFDPERYAPPRSEHEKNPNAFIPQGAGKQMGHKCAGYDLSTVFMQLFAAILVTDYTFTLPEQDRSLRFDRIPPEPKTGLLLRLRKKSATAS